jgi:hypothetical protein
MPLLENIKARIKDNEILIIIILILLILLYLWNKSMFTSKTQNNITTIPNLKNFINSKESFLQSNNKVQFVVYYTNWCGWSKRALAMLNTPEMVDYFKNNPNAELKLIDCESDDGEKICKEQNIKGFPTMKLIKRETIINYEGARNPAAIKEFINRNI